MESGKERPGKAFLCPSERRFVSAGKGDSPGARAMMHPPALCVHRDNYEQFFLGGGGVVVVVVVVVE